MLNANEAVLQMLGSEAEPQRSSGMVTSAAVVPMPPSISNHDQHEPASGVVRKASYGVLAGGAVALGVGLVFGYQSGEAGRQLAAAARDDSGRVTGLTEREAYAFDAKSKQSALFVNVLFAGAVVLAIVGAVMWCPAARRACR